MGVTIYRILKTSEFEQWYCQQSFKTKIIVDARLQRIEVDGHFGTTNTFDGLIELKWKSGLRIYTFRYGREVIVILLGGKNAQNKDIKVAKRIKCEIEESGIDET